MLIIFNWINKKNPIEDGADEMASNIAKINQLATYSLR